MTIADIRKAMVDAESAPARPMTHLCSLEEYEFYKRLGRFDVIAWIKHRTGATDEEMNSALEEYFGGAP